MKFIYYIFFISTFCIGQTVEVKYYENLNSSNEVQFESLPENLKTPYKTNVFSYKLLTNGKQSLYKNEKFKIESKDESTTTTQVNEYNDTIKSTVTYEAFNLQFKEKMHFKDFEKKISYNEKFYDEKICVIDSLNFQNWSLTEETEVLLGYFCKKATFQRNGVEFSAWYTEEIPISDGPFLYSGLPGLILKVSSKYLEIIAYDIKIINDAINISLPPITGKSFTKDEFKKYVEIKNKRF